MQQIEFGDFQTPYELAKQVIELISTQFDTPDIIIEPTCGLGNFIEVAYNRWTNQSNYIGFEINNNYCQSATKKFADYKNIQIDQQNFFTFDWDTFFSAFKNKQITIIGNPPWVNNATIGTFNGDNLPKKSNFQKLKGFEAKTGKANFDIAEWIIIRLIELMKSTKGNLALLCKNATARKVLSHFWKQNIPLGQSSLYSINAKKDFNVSVEACLLVIDFSQRDNKSASVYSSLLEDRTLLYRFGFYNGQLISNLDDYKKYADLDGFSNYRWRSGIKHDASKVMELTLQKGYLMNGFGERVDIEETYLYPLLKSSDIGNGRLTPRRFVIVTQKLVAQETHTIETIAPKTWHYLNRYRSILDNRKSSIYKNRPSFSIFGIGEYSFSKWKVGISSLYKNFTFHTISPYHDKPIMVDDTCYFIPCRSKEEAQYWTRLLNSTEIKRFLHALIFMDAKRAITIDILKRIDMAALSKKLGEFKIANRYLQFAGEDKKGQASFVFEEPIQYP